MLWIIFIGVLSSNLTIYSVKNTNSFHFFEKKKIKKIITMTTIFDNFNQKMFTRARVRNPGTVLSYTSAIFPNRIWNYRYRLDF